MVHIDDWLDLNTFPHAEDALPRTRRFHHLENRFRLEGKSMFWRFILNQTTNEYTLSEPTAVALSPDWFSRIPFHPWSQSGLVWFSINGQNIDWPWRQNRFFRCWGAFCFLVAHVSWVIRCSDKASQQCVPAQLDQKVCNCGLIQYKWPEHWLTFIAQPVFQVLRCLLVLGRASSAGGKIFRPSQSLLCTTVVRPESLYSWFDSV